MPGELNSPYRRDPFTGDFYPKWNEADEVHVAALQESNGLVGFFLFEAPQLRQPSDFICAVLDDEYDETGTPLAENARLDAPDADEFRVDYDAESYLGTGFVEVNASRVGQFFRVGYWGLGTPPRWETHLRAALTVSENFAVAGDLEVGQTLTAQDELNVTGNVVLASGVGATIDASGKRVQNIADGVDAADAVTLAQAETLADSHGVEVFSGASGNWTRPAGTKYLFFAMIGKGGSAAGTNSGGGGGGGAVAGVIDLDAYPVPVGGTLAYSALTDATFAGCTASAGANGTGATAGTGGGFTLSGNAAVVAVGRNGGDGAAPRTGGGGGGAAGNPFSIANDTINVSPAGNLGAGGASAGWLASHGGTAGVGGTLNYGGGRNGDSTAAGGAAVIVLEY